MHRLLDRVVEDYFEESSCMFEPIRPPFFLFFPSLLYLIRNFSLISCIFLLSVDKRNYLLVPWAEPLLRATW